MNLIGLTLRVDIQNERWDCIDQRWYSFLNKCGLTPFLIPNINTFDLSFIKQLKGVILSGGNDLVDIGGDAPERDSLERSILKYCQNHNLPVLGICRGMQIAGMFYGASLEKVSNHVGTCHPIRINNQKRIVNSYHHYGFLEIPHCFEVLARAEDGVIESIRHKFQPFSAIMWHPEREAQPDPLDLQLFKEHFNL